MKIRISRLIINVVFAALLLSLFYMQVVKGAFYRKLSASNCVRLIPQEGCRGRILDRNGNIIVDNYLSYDVVALPEALNSKGRGAAFKKLSGILNVPSDELAKRFKKGRTAAFLPVAIAQDVERNTAIAIEELKTELPGISVQIRPVRHYPYNRLAAHVIGYLGEIDRWRLTRLKDYGYRTKDVMGYSGIEERYDYYLRAENGGLQIEVDHMGNFHEVLGLHPARNGKDIQLTLDLRLQKIVEDNVTDQKGAVIIMDPHTGEILAMASLPNFDPKDFLKKSSPALADILANADAPLLNRAISSACPPGSVFKVIPAAAGLESQKINTRMSFNCAGGLQIGRRRFACWQTHGEQNLIEAIVHSCDVFFYRLGILVGAERMHNFALKFGLGSHTNIDLPSERSGFLPNPLWKRLKRGEGWYDGDTANFAIGQGEVLTTPIQLTRMMAIFANDGFLVSPFIVKSIDGKDVYDPKKRRSPVPIKKETINIIRSGLRGVVGNPTGTAFDAYLASVYVAGKTGTAQAPPGQPHAWFVGFFPFKEPKFVICVFLEHAGSSHVAAVCARKIIEQMQAQGLL